MTFTTELALMSGTAYKSTRDRINRFPVPANWLAENPKTESSGFEAVAFIREGSTLSTSSEIVISYAGTDFSWPFTDFTHANIPLASGVLSSQLKQAADYYLAIKAVNPGATITLTGHSMGGGLASLIAVLFDEKAVTFDQAPFPLKGSASHFIWSSHATSPTH